ncbi:hypothetical protein MPDQ_004397 [Monascus purpureus]|uniref:Phospholipid scramblase n=1 Tax=Monascus purpureus TaxID=5098 RepID=A0A507QLD1_MONPU|nr:hypothetical protein MPDQ_004397 [Monascus purpureus]BDD58688.1 hypothetical protein MAP00_003945 [Monascus purpureus]
MWSATLRPPATWRATGRAALSTFRGHANPRGPRNSLRRPEPISSRSSNPEPALPEQPQADHLNPETPVPGNPNSNYDPAQNTLLAPVHIPEDPNGVLKGNHPATNILANSGLVVQRQLEMMNVMIGFEQANRYVIMDAHGNHVGYMAEQEKGMANMVARQYFRTHRSFVTHVFDRHEDEVLRFHRPFSWINSRIRVYDPLDIASSAYSSSTSLQGTSPASLTQISSGSNTRVSSLGLDDMRLIGEAQQQWAPLRRKYNLFTYHSSPEAATDMGIKQLPLSQMDLSRSQQLQLSRTSQRGEDVGEFNQFAYVDEPFLSWDFTLRSAENRPIGSVNRNFAGFARELFTDTGVYALRMDSAVADPGEVPAGAGNQITGMTLDQRAVMLATAVSIDFDYFSRHSGSGGIGFFPLWFPMSGEAAAGGAAAGEAGAVGEAAAGTVGRAGATGGIADGAAAGAAGAGALAGYDVMQRGLSGDAAQVPPSEQQQQQQQQQADQQSPAESPQEDVWSEERGGDPWGQDADDPWGMGDDESDGSDFF